jgi:hypothetical protein
VSHSRIAGLLAGFALLAGPVAAAPFDGRWALSRDDCRLAPGASDRVPVTIAGNRMDFYESACEITGIEAIGAQDAAWGVVRTCGGEGEVRTVRSIFAVDRDLTGAPRQLIEIDLDDGYVTVRQHCD